LLIKLIEAYVLKIVYCLNIFLFVTLPGITFYTKPYIVPKIISRFIPIVYLCSTLLAMYYICQISGEQLLPKSE